MEQQICNEGTRMINGGIHYVMYDSTACEPQKEVTLEQIIKDSHEALCEIETEVGVIRSVLFGINPDEQKRDDHPCSIDAALMDDVATEKRIIQMLSYILGRLR